jgi:hypothetical protein
MLGAFLFILILGDGILSGFTTKAYIQSNNPLKGDVK